MERHSLDNVKIQKKSNSSSTNTSNPPVNDRNNQPMNNQQPVVEYSRRSGEQYNNFQQPPRHDRGGISSYINQNQSPNERYESNNYSNQPPRREYSRNNYDVEPRYNEREKYPASSSSSNNYSSNNNYSRNDNYNNRERRDDYDRREKPYGGSSERNYDKYNDRERNNSRSDRYERDDRSNYNRNDRYSGSNGGGKKRSYNDEYDRQDDMSDDRRSKLTRHTQEYSNLIYTNLFKITPKENGKMYCYSLSVTTESKEEDDKKYIESPSFRRLAWEAFRNNQDVKNHIKSNSYGFPLSFDTTVIHNSIIDNLQANGSKGYREISIKKRGSERHLTIFVQLSPGKPCVGEMFERALSFVYATLFKNIGFSSISDVFVKRSTIGGMNRKDINAMDDYRKKKSNHYQIQTKDLTEDVPIDGRRKYIDFLVEPGVESSLTILKSNNPKNNNPSVYLATVFRPKSISQNNIAKVMCALDIKKYFNQVATYLKGKSIIYDGRGFVINQVSNFDMNSTIRETLLFDEYEKLKKIENGDNSDEAKERVMSKIERIKNDISNMKTFASYFEDKNKLQKEFTKLPLLRVVMKSNGRVIMVNYLPPELCYIISTTKETARKAPKIGASGKNGYVQDVFKELKEKNGEFMENVGIELDDKPLAITKETLTTPTIKSSIDNMRPNIDYNFNIRVDESVVYHAIYSNSNPIALITHRNLDSSLIDKIYPTFSASDAASRKKYLCDIQSFSTKDLERLKQLNVKLAIIAAQDSSDYSKFKRMFQNSGISVQYINISAMSKRKDKRQRDSTQKCIAIQSTVKMGINVWNTGNLDDNNDIFIVGVEIDNGRRELQSYIVMSTERNGVGYTSDVITTQKTPDQGKQLGDKIFEFITNNVNEKSSASNQPQRSGKQTKHVIVYVSGLILGTSGLLESLEKSHTSDELDVHMYVIAVNKDTNIRFRTSMDSFGNSDNVDIGTYTKGLVGSQNDEEFYISSCKVKQQTGQSKPVRYVVLHRSKYFGNYNLDMLTNITYKLSYMYSNWLGSVRIPCHLMYASRLKRFVKDTKMNVEELKGSSKNGLYFI